MKNLSFCTLIFLILVSCSNDGSDTSTINPEVTIKGYKITSISAFVDGSFPTYKTETTGNLHNGKLFSETHEIFSGGVSQGAPVTIQHYFYEGNLLVAIRDNTNEGKKREFYYDNQNRMIGAKMTINSNNTNPSYIYYRFVQTSNSVVFFEKLSKPYNDPNAEIFFRNILEFDLNDNVIKAGGDSNLDGISEQSNQFTYLNNNLVAVQKADGTIINYTYSNVIDTSNKLYEKSVGYKNSRIICSEVYASSFFSNFNQSKNLLSQEIIDNSYEVLSSNFYKKKTLTQDLGDLKLTNIRTTEFFFN